MHAMVRTTSALVLAVVAAVAGLSAPAVAQSSDGQWTDNSKLPACAGANAKTQKTGTPVQLYCDDSGLGQLPNSKLYICKPQGEKNTYRAEVTTVKDTTGDSTQQIAQIILVNKRPRNGGSSNSGSKIQRKVYSIGGTTPKFSYWELDGYNSCVVEQGIASKFGSFDPSRVFVADSNAADSKCKSKHTHTHTHPSKGG